MYLLTKLSTSSGAKELKGRIRWLGRGMDLIDERTWVSSSGVLTGLDGPGPSTWNERKGSGNCNTGTWACTRLSLLLYPSNYTSRKYLIVPLLLIARELLLRAWVIIIRILSVRSLRLDRKWTPKWGTTENLTVSVSTGRVGSYGIGVEIENMYWLKVTHKGWPYGKFCLLCWV